MVWKALHGYRGRNKELRRRYLDNKVSDLDARIEEDNRWQLRLRNMML